MLKYHIQTIEVGSGGASTITFSSIPQTYDDLLILWSVSTTQANTNSWFLINGSSSNLSVRSLFGSGSGVTSETTARLVAGTDAETSNFSNVSMYIPNYASSIASKSWSIDAVEESNATTAYQTLQAGLYSSTSPITSLTITDTAGGPFRQYSSASLYGIKRGASGQVEVASGGTITTSGGYTIHTFNSSGTFVANRDLDVEYLVVAGGGGGGFNFGGGGGGAGGYRTSVVGALSGNNTSAEQPIRLYAGNSYAVIVGAGGAISSSGANSSIASISSNGGGFGGKEGLNAASGGSGGGAGFVTSTAGAATSNQGTSGGNGATTGGNASAGGGGGASTAGVNATLSAAGNGGDGISSNITGSSIVRAGGGGGSHYREGTTPVAGTGGAGGGGNGSRIGANGSGPVQATSGSANTGSGGGGGVGPVASQPSNAAAGGSGVVILRYLTPA